MTTTLESTPIRIEAGYYTYNRYEISSTTVRGTTKWFIEGYGQGYSYATLKDACATIDSNTLRTQKARATVAKFGGEAPVASDEIIAFKKDIEELNRALSDVNTSFGGYQSSLSKWSGKSIEGQFEDINLLITKRKDDVARAEALMEKVASYPADTMERANQFDADASDYRSAVYFLENDRFWDITL